MQTRLSAKYDWLKFDVVCWASEKRGTAIEGKKLHCRASSSQLLAQHTARIANQKYQKHAGTNHLSSRSL